MKLDMLKKVKNKKLIKIEEVVKNAKKVRESLKEEIKYLEKIRRDHGNNISYDPYYFA